MGVLILHVWGSLLAQASAAYVIWGGFFGIFYRKYFWDLIGGTLGPNGIIPPPQAKLFITLIVDLPVLQIVNIVNGLVTLALEWPAPYVQQTSIYRSLIFRVVFYTFCAVIAMLPYQTFDAGVFYFIAAMVYLRAVTKGEVMEVAKSQRVLTSKDIFRELPSREFVRERDSSERTESRRGYSIRFEESYLQN